MNVLYSFADGAVHLVPTFASWCPLWRGVAAILRFPLPDLEDAELPPDP